MAEIPFSAHEEFPSARIPGQAMGLALASGIITNVIQVAEWKLAILGFSRKTGLIFLYI